MGQVICYYRRPIRPSWSPRDEKPGCQSTSQQIRSSYHSVGESIIAPSLPEGEDHGNIVHMKVKASTDAPVWVNYHRDEDAKGLKGGGGVRYECCTV